MRKGPGSRRLRWHIDDPAEPGRPALGNPGVKALIREIDPTGTAQDLGGLYSLNVHIEPAGLVLRVHQPFVTRNRLRALQRLREALRDRGLIVPTALPHRGQTLFHCGNRWAELEHYIPNERLPYTPDTYLWLFGALGRLHRELAAIDVPVPRPPISTYGPPRSLYRWLRFTEAAIAPDGPVQVLDRTRRLVGQLQRQWIPSTRLPCHLTHGDVRPGNVHLTLDGRPVYFDFGFAAVRPRVHDLGYALAWMVEGLKGAEDPAAFDWSIFERVVGAYDGAAGEPLSVLERQALIPYTASIPLYFTAIAGYTSEPAKLLRWYRCFLNVSEWLLSQNAGSGM